MRFSRVKFSLPQLVYFSHPRCEWAFTMAGMTVRPFRSTVIAPFGAWISPVLPTCVIMSRSTRNAPFSIAVPSPTITRAPVNSTPWSGRPRAGCASSLPNAVAHTITAPQITLMMGLMNHSGLATRADLLRLSTERTPIRPRMERLVAVPAESGLRHFPRLEPRLDLGHLLAAFPRSAPGHSNRRAAADSQDVLEQVRRARVAHGEIRGKRPQHDVVQRLGNPVVLESRRRYQLAAHESLEVSRCGRVVRQHAGEHLVIV